MARRTMIVGAVLAALALLLLTPAARARVAAAGTVVEGLALGGRRPFAPPVAAAERSIGEVTADVYAPGGDAPAVVLVPGAVPAGRDDARVRRVARALARADRRVVVPELELYDQRLVGGDVERLVDVVRALSSEGRPVVLVGISFGGSLSLVAAADPRLDRRLAGVATFGAYADLVGLLQAATTGASLVDGRRIPWDGDPRAREVARRELTSLLAPAEAQAVRDALAGDGGAEVPDGDARTVHHLLRNDDPARTHPLVEGLSSPLRRRLAAVSPVSVADRLADVPVVAMHAADDAVVPHAELLRLGRAVPHARLLTVDSFEHADLRLTSPGAWVRAVDDLATVWTFASRALRWQEPRWPWGAG